MRRAAASIAAVSLLALGFAWGFLAHRDGIFPYDWIRRYVRGFRNPGAGSVDSPSLDQRRQLESLPYVAARFDPRHEDRGVLVYERARAQEGLNFYHQAREPEARIVTMTGELVHRWSAPTRQWEHAEPLPDGDLIVVIKNQQLLRLDSRSRVLWRSRVRVHHSVDVRPGGEIYAIERERRLVPELHPVVPVVDDLVAVFDAGGEPQRRWSVLDALLRSPYAMLLPRVGGGRFAEAGDVDELDLLHANHIQVLDGALADRSPAFASGNVLVSLRNINTLVVLDGESGDVVWAWGPSNLVRQHTPVLLGTGTLLVFNNGVEQSEVLELDPLDFRIVWRWAPGPEFHSGTRGSAQRLPNGNTLVTDSERGYVHELDPSGEVVWEFANPEVSPDGEREIIWSMRRYPPEAFPFLEPDGVLAPGE